MSLQGHGNRPGWRVMVEAQDHQWKAIGAAWARQSGFSVVLRALPFSPRLRLEPAEGVPVPVPEMDYVVSVNTTGKFWMPIGAARSHDSVIQITLFAMANEGRFCLFEEDQQEPAAEIDSLDRPVSFDMANPY